YVEDGVKSGLSIFAQGRIAPDAPAGGFYYPPTILANVPIDHKLAQEEIFGPVLVTSTFTTESEALALANGTEYGLVAGV
ncbi:aldehyde dehydrogenase family protein, partial [Acinetobacter baumannii]